MNRDKANRDKANRDIKHKTWKVLTFIPSPSVFGSSFIETRLVISNLPILKPISLMLRS